MVITLWENGGKIVENAAGDALVECATCPCVEACTNCDTGTTPGSVTVTFGAGTNLSGDEAECAGEGPSNNCDNFAAAWELPQLNQAQVTAAKAACSVSIANPNIAPPPGCYFALTEGLPCGCTLMLLEILDGGTSGAGFATGGLTMCWGGTSDWVRLDWGVATADTDQDCLTNIDTAGGGVDSLSWSDSGAGEPCDFLGTFPGAGGLLTRLDIVANA